MGYMTRSWRTSVPVVLWVVLLGSQLAVADSLPSTIRSPLESSRTGHVRADILLGDLNGDGKVTVNELVRAVNFSLGRITPSAEELSRIDGNGDGQVSIGEITLATNNALEGPPTDNEQEVTELVMRGKEALASADVLNAFLAFQRAHQLDQRHQEANFYLAITRVLSWTSRHQNDFAALGFISAHQPTLAEADLNPLRFHAIPPALITVPPKFAYGVDVQRFLLTDLKKELLEAQDDLAKISRGFVSRLPVRNPLTGTPDVEFDDTDVAFARAAAHIALAEIYTAQVYNLNIGVEPVGNAILQDRHDFALQQLLTDYPNLLRLYDATFLSDVKRELLAASEEYLTADALLRAETDDQADDLLAFSNLKEDHAKADLVRAGIAQLQGSLSGISDPLVTLDLKAGRVGDETRVNPNILFDQPLQARDFLPEFNFDVPIPESWPDPTFHGIAPDLTDEQLKVLSRSGRTRGRAAPFLREIADRMSISEHEQIVLSLEAFDWNGPASLLTFTTRGLPPGATLIPNSDTPEAFYKTATFSWIPGDTQAGVYRVTFVVRDPDQLAAMQTVTITVTESRKRRSNKRLRVRRLGSVRHGA